MPIIQNKLNTQAVTLSTANETFTLANFVLDGETINAMDITQVYWTSNGNWTVSRGGTLLLNLPGADHWEMDGIVAFRANNDQSIVVNNNGGTGTLMLVVKKQITPTDPLY